jgi:uncharacterized protein (TIGR00106 family)
MEISVVPVGTGTPSISDYVAHAVNLLRKRRGVRYEVTAMGTIVEAERVEELLEAALELHRSVLARGAARVLTRITIDDRIDKTLTMAGKVRSVREKLAGVQARR